MTAQAKVRLIIGGAALGAGGMEFFATDFWPSPVALLIVGVWTVVSTWKGWLTL